jgi:hypothetical protein
MRISVEKSISLSRRDRCTFPRLAAAYLGRERIIALIVFPILFVISSVSAQQVPQTPSPMADNTRPHPRITQTQVNGRRIQLTTLKGAQLFVGTKVNPRKAVPLIVHFHGFPWLVEYHIATHFPRAVLITVNLGSGSSAYGRPFEQPDLFQAMIDEASEALSLKQGWSSITLSGFSAGYGAVRAILRQEKNIAIVNNVLLLDGMHASYSPEGKLLADGGSVNATDLDSFVTFAREAVAGRKTFVFSHSEIFPGTYASTTECAEYLLWQLGIKSKAHLKNGPIGMQQLSITHVGGLSIFGYAGNTAPDHVDHLQAMPFWFKRLRIR